MWTLAALPWLTRGKTIPYDAKDEFFPRVVFTVQSLLRGQAPFWDPYLFSGYPAFADPQAMTFSPTVVLPMLLSQSVVWFDIVIHFFATRECRLVHTRTHGSPAWRCRSSSTSVFKIWEIA